MNGAREFVANLSDGTDVTVEVDGDHITRSMDLEGANIRIKTDIERADFSETLGKYESVRQELAPKQKRSENALSFLENPTYAELPLEDMKDGLRKILGYTLYSELGVSGMMDKKHLVSTLKRNVGDYTRRLDRAQKRYKEALKTAIERNQERYRENDEKIKTTLKALKYSSLGLWGVEYLTTHIKAGFITPVIGASFDRQNIDLAHQNF